MKVLIVDISENHVIGLKNNGNFIKLDLNKNYSIGCEIEINVISPKIPMKKIMSIAATLIIILGISTGTYAYYQPYSYINIDINPSIEITSNIFDRILEIKGLNEDGKKVIKGISIKNESLDDGILDIVNNVVSLGYLNKNTENNILLSISQNNNNKALITEKKISKEILTRLSEENIKPNLFVEKSTMKKHELATTLGTSPGKLNLIEKLKTNNSEMKITNLNNKSLKEIMDIMKNSSKSKTTIHDTDSENKQKNKSETIPANKSTGVPLNKPTSSPHNKSEKKLGIKPTDSQTNKTKDAPVHNPKNTAKPKDLPVNRTKDTTINSEDALVNKPKDETTTPKDIEINKPKDALKNSYKNNKSTNDSTDTKSNKELQNKNPKNNK